MANVKISALPSYTGSAADLRWFVMNNSGETETFKYSGYTSPYKITGTNTLFSYGVGSSADTSINYGVAIGNNSTLFSYDPTGNYVPGAESSVAIGDTALSWGSSAVVIGDNVIGGAKSVIIGNNIPSWRNFAGEPNFIIGSDITGVNNYFRGGVYILGNNFESTSDGHQICIGLGLGAGNTTGRYSINMGWETRASGGASIAVGNRTQVSGGNSVMLMGDGNSSALSSDYSTLVGGGTNSITGSNTYSSIFGSYNSSIGGIAGWNSLLGGSTNSITNNLGSVILGGGNCNIQSSSINLYNSIITSNNTTIPNGLSYVSMIGNVSGRTATASATTYVENLHLYRTPSTAVQPISSGTTFTCDLELGAKSQFYITGTSTINITNVRDGASFMIKTQTDGNYVMTWTSPGYTFLFEGGLKDPGNTTIDIFKFEVFGNVIYGSRAHNFS